VCTVTGSPSAAEVLGLLETAAGQLADLASAEMPADAAAELLRGMERADAVQAAARGSLLRVFDAKDGHLGDGQRTTRSWLAHSLRVTPGQAAEYKALQAVAADHGPLQAGLRGRAVTKSVALELARWTKSIPAEFRDQAEEILIAAFRAGAGRRELAAICAEIRWMSFCIIMDVWTRCRQTGRKPSSGRAYTPV
jgi:hypothetical protein